MKRQSGQSIHKLYKLFFHILNMVSAINDLIYRPEWFIPTEFVFEIISIVITLIIFIYSYKIYKLSNNKRYYYLSLGFLAMAMGFLFKVINSSVVLFNLNHGFFVKVYESLIIPIVRHTYVYTASLILYAFLILSGYIIISCLALNIKSKKVIFSLLFIAFLAAILIRQARSFTFFYFFAFFLLAAHILPYMYENFKKQKSQTSFLVFLSFLFLTLANLVFIGITNYGVKLYIIGQSLSLVGYILLMINLVLVLRK